MLGILMPMFSAILLPDSLDTDSRVVRLMFCRRDEGRIPPYERVFLLPFSFEL